MMDKTETSKPDTAPNLNCDDEDTEVEEQGENETYDVEKILGSTDINVSKIFVIRCISS